MLRWETCRCKLQISRRVLADEAANDALVGLGQDSKPRKDADVSLVPMLESLSLQDCVGRLEVHERPDLLYQTLFMRVSVLKT